MMINSATYISVLRDESPDLDWKVALLPEDESRQTFLSAENLSVGAASKNPDAAWELIEFMQRPDELATYLPERNKLPARDDVPGVTDDPVRAVFAEQLQDAWAPDGDLAAKSNEVFTYLQDLAAGRRQRLAGRRGRPGRRTERDRRGVGAVTTTSVEHPVGRPTERTGGSGSVGPRRRERRLGDYVFLVPAVVFVVLTVLYPVGYNIVQSFQDVGLAQIVGGGAEFVGLDNYRDQFGRSAFWDSLAISLVYTVGTVALTFVTGLRLALLFNRVFPGRNVMRSLLLMAWILPTVVSANVWRWLLDGTYGLVSTPLSGVGLIDSDTFFSASRARPDRGRLRDGVDASRRSR